MGWTIKRNGRVAVVTMNTNEANAQNDTFFKDLHGSFDRLETDHADSPVVLTGQGHIFSAGIDFTYTFPIFARSDPEEITEWFERYRATNLRLLTYHRPVVAAVNGHAIAGGLITALACDYRLCASGDAKLGLNEVPVGIPMPSVYVELIRHACGNHVAALCTLFGELYTPERSLQLGFVHELVKPDELLAAAIERANKISDDALDAYAGSKRALLAPVLRRIDEISVEHDRRTTRGTVSARSKSANAAALEKIGK